MTPPYREPAVWVMAVALASVFLFGALMSSGAIRVVALSAVVILLTEPFWMHLIIK